MLQEGVQNFIVAEYFENFRVVKAREKRRAVPPRYYPQLYIKNY